MQLGSTDKDPKIVDRPSQCSPGPGEPKAPHLSWTGPVSAGMFGEAAGREVGSSHLQRHIRRGPITPHCCVGLRRS